MLLAIARTESTSPLFLTGARTDTTAALPAAVRAAMGRLTDPRLPRYDPRGADRQTYHVTAALTWGAAVRTTVYTRDVNARTVGFIGTVPLPTAAKVTLRLAGPDGFPLTVLARVRRSRPFGHGAWFETYAEFCLPQYSFEQV